MGQLLTKIRNGSNALNDPKCSSYKYLGSNSSADLPKYPRPKNTLLRLARRRPLRLTEHREIGALGLPLVGILKCLDSTEQKATNGASASLLVTSVPY